jgi:N-acetylglucosamine-6-phosphate deacetylase
MLITNGKLYLEETIIENGFIYIKDNKIVSVGDMKYVPTDNEVIDANGQNVLPGFIDQHIHGANGADNMDATQEAVHNMASFLPKEGTTSYLATTMTQSVENINKALYEIAEYAENNNPAGEAEVLGIHLEGPFISIKRVGAQNPNYVLVPTKEAFNVFWKQSKGLIKIITYAPEEAEEGFTNYLRELNVIPSAGHSDAYYDDIVKEIPNGLSNLTHFHNAMTPHHHRDPGAVTAGFVYPALKAEIIVDGIHLAPSVVNATYKIKGADNIILITDAMRAKGLEDGEYDLGGQMVIKTGKECRISNGSLAGSVAEMDFVIRNMKNFTRAPMAELVKMSSSNSAKHLQVFDRKGSLTAGKDADIVIVNDNIEVQVTICRGKVGYQA